MCIGALKGPEDVNDLPDQVIDNHTYNKIGKIIVNSLYAESKAIKTKLEQTGNSIHLNIINIFFHELVSSFFSEISANCELRITKPDNPITHPDQHPYFYRHTFDEAINRQCKPYTPKKINKNAIGNLQRYFFSLLQHPKADLHITCTDISATELLSTVKTLKKRWRITKHDYNPAQISIPYLSDQFAHVENCIKNIEQNVRAKILSSYKTAEGFQRAITASIKPFIGRYKHNFSDILITKSPGVLSNRIIASNYLAKGKTVISLSHGEYCGVKDEPIYGYTENSFCTHKIGYGKLGCKNMLSGKYNGKTLTPAPSIFPSSSDKIRSLYISPRVRRYSDFNKNKILYVPTSFTGIHRYAPHQSLNDFAYYKWQVGLVEEFSTNFESVISIKLHHKDRYKPYRACKNVKLIIDTQFEYMLNEFDALIFDYISTAFTLAAATDKPIFFFDIGIRNLTPDGLKAIRERTIYTKADPVNPMPSVKEAFNARKTTCTNNYTTQFCIGAKSDKRSKTLVDIIEQTLT